mmetsp:Transcript_42934/g.121401  ORF Transcript_42934/g.121401 Transcript_42934/m.121401 type:complete len:236 (-) Transcript_42934:100-807(-)
MEHAEVPHGAVEGGSADLLAEPLERADLVEEDGLGVGVRLAEGLHHGLPTLVQGGGLHLHGELRGVPGPDAQVGELPRVHHAADNGPDHVPNGHLQVRRDAGDQEVPRPAAIHRLHELPQGLRLPRPGVRAEDLGRGAGGHRRAAAAEHGHQAAASHEDLSHLHDEVVAAGVDHHQRLLLEEPAGRLRNLRAHQGALALSVEVAHERASVGEIEDPRAQPTAQDRRPTRVHVIGP